MNFSYVPIKNVTTILYIKVDGWYSGVISKMGWRSTQHQWLWSKLCLYVLSHGWVKMLWMLELKNDQI